MEGPAISLPECGHRLTASSGSRSAISVEADRLPGLLGSGLAEQRKGLSGAEELVLAQVCDGLDVEPVSYTHLTLPTTPYV